MEELNAKLFRLLKDELRSLNMGHSYNKKRLAVMKGLCHLIAYLKYADLQKNEIKKIVNIYEYA